jgi:septal ring factor EnvC (AmiA/AmiB activator)
MNIEKDESMKRGELKLNRLLQILSEKKIILENIATKEEETIHNLEKDIEDEKNKITQQETEFNILIESFEDIQNKIDVAEEELKEVSDKILSRQDFNEKIESLEQELMFLKEESKTKLKTYKSKIKFFFCSI